MTFLKRTSPMRGLNDISLLLFRVHVIHNKPQKLSIINPQSCILRIIKTYCLIKPSFSSLEWRNAIFFFKPFKFFTKQCCCWCCYRMCLLLLKIIRKNKKGDSFLKFTIEYCCRLGWQPSYRHCKAWQRAALPFVSSVLALMIAHSVKCFRWRSSALFCNMANASL